MSMGKRLAKRSIVGSKVVALHDDGFYYPGTIQAVKTAEMDGGVNGGHQITKYAVRSEATRQLREYSEVDLVGPGFQSIAGITMNPGQKVFVTYGGREVSGHVVKHRPDVDEVCIALQGSNLNDIEIVKRLEEVRLLESRKSLRLMDHSDMDFARMAEGGVASAGTSTDLIRKRPGTASGGIDVPGATFMSRKRRSSPDVNDNIRGQRLDDDEDEDVMDECAAAMVLMRLSCSPNSPRWEELAALRSSGNQSSSSSSGAFSWRSSMSSSGDSPPHVSGGGGGGHRKLKIRSASPSPVLCGSAPASFLGGSMKLGGVKMDDDGIVSDESISEDDSTKLQRRVSYQCTWPGCSFGTRTCSSIESHVRAAHLGPRKEDDVLSDHEEEFYYTEVEEEEEAEAVEAEEEDSHESTLSEIAVTPTAFTFSTKGFSFSGLHASPPPTLSHMDMVRPPHEDPEYKRVVLKGARPIAIPARVRSISWSSGYGYGSYPQKQAKVSAPSKASNFSVKSSPVRRPRGDAKKCRKVYGMENREMWCTQCKWKKACTRFGD